MRTLTGEWLLANGLGGYAMGTLDGPPTRGYHGFLVAATRPPDGRVLLVGPIESRLVVDGTPVRLDALETAPGHVEGRPPLEAPGRLEAFLPTWTFEVNGVSVEQKAWMIRDANATVVRWRRLDEGATPVRLLVTPLVACRDHHPAGAANPAPARVDIDRARSTPRVEVSWEEQRPVLRMEASDGAVRAVDRIVPVFHREDDARGTSPDDLYRAVATFEADLAADGELVLVLATDAGSVATAPAPGWGTVAAAGTSLRAVLERDEELSALAGLDGRAAGRAHARGLAVAADRFLVRRRAGGGSAASDRGRTVIAGYPWFGDWGRDTMIALPGLALATGRHAEGARILRTWAALLRDGLLPNLFPEASAGTPAYHAVDAPLWFIHALGEHEAATGDGSLARDLRPAVESIIAAYRDGTRFGIGVDPGDGLVRAGEPGVQLTWMDAKVHGVPVTPRHGKPVEVQALWVNALRRASRWAEAAGSASESAAHLSAAEVAERSFRGRFRRPGLAWLADVVDGPDGDDASLRPNQLLALSLPHPLVDGETALSSLDAIARHLLVPGGVRTLAAFEPGYRPRFQGPPAERDAAYHQGAAWTWLLGPWLDSVARFRGADAARDGLSSALAALDPDASGAIPELVEPEEPFTARGCPWQAWGVAELLRVHRRLEG